MFFCYVQPDQLNKAVLFWYLVKSDAIDATIHYKQILDIDESFYAKIIYFLENKKKALKVYSREIQVSKWVSIDEHL